MFCYNCGKEIDDKAVVCVHCGVETKNMKSNDDRRNIVINNSASASSSNPNMKVRKKYNLLIDLILIVCTAGLWIIWMLIRPKYEY